MALKRITSRLPEEKLKALDSIAEVQLRDYHRALIEDGIRQDDAGDVLAHETVVSMIANYRRS